MKIIPLCMLMLALQSTPVVWENTANAPPGAREQARVVLDLDTAVVAERDILSGGPCSMEIAAYDKASGALLWQDTLPTPGVKGFLAKSGTTVFAAVNTATSPYAIMVRAYDPAGHALWTSTVNSSDQIQGLSASMGRVTVIGSRVEPGTQYTQGFISTLDATTGAPVWEALIDNGPDSTYVWEVDANASTVVTYSQKVLAGTNTRTPYIEARSASTGALLWHISEGAPPSVTALTINQGHVYAIGATAGPKAAIVAIDAAAGSILWQENSVPGAFYGLAANASQVVVAGIESKPDGAQGARIESHNPDTGALVWSDVTPTTAAPNGTYGSDYFQSVAVDATGVYAVGISASFIQTSILYTEAMIRAYQPSGHLRFDDRSHHSTNTSNYSFWSHVTIQGQYLMTAGAASDGATPAATVRVLDILATQKKPRPR